MRQRGGGQADGLGFAARRGDCVTLWAAHLRNKGRYGSPASRLLLQAASDGARSIAERLLVKLLRDRRHHRMDRRTIRSGDTRSTSAFRGPKVAIEVDGFAFHSGPVEFQVDRERQNNIALLGWQVLRFTWLDLTEYPQRVLAVIRSAISA